ncbi:desmoglein-2-like protein [Engraulis encrasicolus]|uniref:desmoglein-2-like protein n=1 Tax=Engraulis encrasicolus TaxID=184585 RepID=UPI002FD26744
MAHATAMCTILVPILILITQVQGYGKELQKLHRQKREWIIPPRKLEENVDETKKEFIAKIRSDYETRNNIRYSLLGKGATEDPVNLFTVNTENGYVRINGILDREEKSRYYLQGVAKFANGTRAEKDIELVIMVIDQNDCPPVFSFEEGQSVAEIYELSEIGTSVMTVTATDADEPNTLHSQISYSLVQEGSSNMFYIDRQTGEVSVRTNALDREVQDVYTLTVKGTDMNGAPGGNSGTGKVVIRLMDVNDNVPTLENTHYEANVMENTFNVTVLKIKALDLDLIHTDNWLAIFTIVSGNEAGYFTITTDKKTNEGILVLNKPIDYEELKELNLQVVVSNVAKYHSSVIITETKTYPIKIHVQNEAEGPRFHPSVKVVTVSEDHTTIDLKQIITTYKAIDSDTLLHATNVIYLKGEDKDNWISIDQTTADIRLNKLPDRESKYLINGTYYAKIICVSKDSSQKTATGTIAIQVEDSNDHCPTLVHPTQTVCFEENVDHVVYVTAVDGDAFPNGAPFDFKITSSTTEQWSVERLLGNDTTVILRPKQVLWPGPYKVYMVIRDQQGEPACGDVQVLDLEVCSCDKDLTCLPRKDRGPSAVLGAAGVLMLLLGMLLLLLLPLLLLFCLCGTGALAADFKTIPWGAKEHLIAYHTEGQGEDKAVPLLDIPVVDGGDGGFAKIGQVGVTGAAGAGLGGGLSGSSHFGKVNNNNEYEYNQWSSQVNTGHGGWMGQGQFGEGHYGEGRFEYGSGGASGHMGLLEGIALSEEFLGEYYSQKASCIEDLQTQKAEMLIYEYEGRESPAGSVGCCSLLEDDNDLAFLNDLGPKFKTLAEICGGGATVIESSSVTVTASPPPPPQPPVTTHVSSHVSSHVDISGDIANSISAARAEASSLATSSSVLQESIISSGRPATTTVHVKENGVVPTQTLLIQQPTLYYAAAPPMYVVDPQPHHTLMVTPAVNVGQNLVMLESNATSQLQGISQGVVGMGNIQGAHGLVLVEGMTSAAGEQQVIGTLGKRQVVTVETQQGTRSGFGTGTGHSATLGLGSASLAETVVSAASGRLHHEASGGLIQVIPSQASASQSVGLRGQSASSFSVMPETVIDGTHKVVVQEKVSVTERTSQSSSLA